MVQVNPKLTRFVIVSSTQHRATLGMMGMQLLGYRFIRALEGGLGNWTPPQH